MKATNASKVKSVAALFLTHCKGTELVPYIGTKLKWSWYTWYQYTETIIQRNTFLFIEKLNN